MSGSHSEPIWIDANAVVLIHQRQLAEHGGLTGMRDEGMLESSLAAPKQQHLYAPSDLYSLAACYGARIAGNHPFVDGNKRTAWTCTRLFLRLNGLDIEATAVEKVKVMLAVAAGFMSQAELADWLRDHGREAQ
ncbi:MAG: type II toxin-antitoxin system death-on-curing family toxin [Chromatiaceae bacterium]|nr:type II toxin-antitoxin system death-on-curing family toxin [Chromatiaceae bacterium]